jgi:hypothetical protein
LVNVKLSDPSYRPQDVETKPLKGKVRGFIDFKPFEKKEDLP